MFGYDLKQAFTYFFNKQNKSGIIAIIVAFLLLIPFLPVLFGFYCTLINQRVHKPNLKYYATDESKILKAGLSITVVLILPTIAVLLLSILSSIWIIFATMGNNISDANGSSIVAMVIFILLIFIIFVTLMSLVFLILSILLSIDLKFSSLFNLKLIKFVFIKNFAEILKLFVVYFLLIIIMTIIDIITYFTIIIPLLISMYITTALADIQAQFIRKIFKVEQKEEAHG